VTLREACTYIAAFAGLISGALWLTSGWVGVRNRRDPPVAGPTADGAITVRFGRRHPLLAPTLRLQSTVNGYAALAASVAAFAQLMLLYLKWSISLCPGCPALRLKREGAACRSGRRGSHRGRSRFGYARAGAAAFRGRPTRFGFSEMISETTPAFGVAFLRF
jgi:hypothetical protein